MLTQDDLMEWEADTKLSSAFLYTQIPAGGWRQPLCES